MSIVNFNQGKENDLWTWPPPRRRAPDQHPAPSDKHDFDTAQSGANELKNIEDAFLKKGITLSGLQLEYDVRTKTLTVQGTQLNRFLQQQLRHSALQLDGIRAIRDLTEVVN
jgi:hypothetical protein